MRDDDDYYLHIATFPVDPDAPTYDELYDSIVFIGRESCWYTPDGEPCTMREWGEHITDWKHKRVAASSWDEKGWWVSTVYTGHAGLTWSGPPLIYETMAFTEDEGSAGEYMDRYPTREAAQAGHDQVVAQLTDLLGTPPDDPYIDSVADRVLGKGDPQDPGGATVDP